MRVNMEIDTLVVGAGLTAATMAERLASRGERVLVVDSRPHIGGNTFEATSRNGHAIHKYGPHIFHTNSDVVWRYLSRFTGWRPYEHRVLGRSDERLVPIPFNLISLRRLLPRSKAKTLRAALIDTYGMDSKVPILRLRHACDAQLRWLADFVYEKVFVGYTTKMWGAKPEEIDPSVTGRVPVHVSDDDRYFQDKYQAMPLLGYNRMVQRILEHRKISIRLGLSFNEIESSIRYKRLIYTGGIDALFDYELGHLPYRSIDFVQEHRQASSVQPVATINFPSAGGPTRSTEQKKLTGQISADSTLVWEYPRAHEPGVTEAYYPVPNEANRKLHESYVALARNLRPNMVLAGRLADYKYYNMDQAVGRALVVSRRLREAHRH